MTKQNGVNVWPNAAIWMWDELRSEVMLVEVLPCVQTLICRNSERGLCSI